MVKNYELIIERGLEALPKLSAAEILTLCEALDVQRRAELLQVATHLVAVAPLAEPRLRGQYFYARAYLNRGDHETAWGQLIETLNAAKEEVGATSVYIDCLMSLAGIALKIGDSNQSMGLATEAFNLAQDSQYAKGFAAACNHFGSLKLQQGDVAGAVEYLDEALKHALPLQLHAVLYPIYSNLGIAHMLLGNVGSALQFFNQTLQDSHNQGHSLGEALTCINIANLYTGQGNYPKALQYGLRALAIYEALNDDQNTSYALGLLGDIYKDLHHNTESINYYQKALALRERIQDDFGKATSYYHLGTVLVLQEAHDEAAEHLLHALEISEEKGYTSLLAMVYLELGGLYILQGRHHDAFEALQLGKDFATTAGHKHLQNKYLQYSGQLNIAQQRPEDALPLLLEAEKLAAQLGMEDDLRKHWLYLSQCYEQLGDSAQALAYYKRYYAQDKKLHGEENAKYIASMEFAHQLEQKTKEAEIERIKHVELKKAYEELQQAQDRLVQQEKLVSLGRLVTGIAHELQNPLNFVANFSALSLDLVDELGDITDETERNEVLGDIKENLTKINVHGKRVSDIIKSMLELKRDSGAAPQPVALDRIVGEFVPLAWNNYRSKCPDLQVQIEIVPHEKDIFARVITVDVGRAIINVMHNALDAVREAHSFHGGIYTPSVSVTIEKLDGLAKISVADNGLGISDDKLGLIFDPFYTTKPSGSGNIGLGLSLAHDMVVAQGGSIQVESQPNMGATFSILLPLAD